jgi:nicotinamidase-related amidase
MRTPRARSTVRVWHRSRLRVVGYIVTRCCEGEAPALASAVRAVEAARAANVPVILLRVAFRPGYLEVNAGNKGALAGYGDAYDENSAGTVIPPPAFEVKTSDPVVLK